MYKIYEKYKGFFITFYVLVIVMVGALTYFLINENIPKKEKALITKETVGKITWTYLHSTIENTEHCGKQITNENLINLITTVGDLFPCQECSEHFKEMMKTEKLEENVKNRDNFNVWFCQIHNIVNKRLNKKIFDCSKNNLALVYGMKKS
jgi:mitochondrial FAD-linked sulfhydryl oxidase